jgi:hypothetical protein
MSARKGGGDSDTHSLNVSGERINRFMFAIITRRKVRQSIAVRDVLPSQKFPSFAAAHPTLAKVPLKFCENQPVLGHFSREHIV